MKTAIFQYKCRLCGEIYKDAHTSEATAQYVLIGVVGNFKHMEDSISVGQIPKMIGCHAGCKKGYGVSDLLGYVVKD